MEKMYSIQFVANMTGVNAHTLRAWEKRYNAVVPSRNNSGKRMYSQAELDRLLKLAELVSLGNAISEVAVLKDEELLALHDDYLKFKLSSDKTLAPNRNENSKIDTNMSLNNMVTALNHYKLDIISHELEKIKKALGPREFALNILSPLLHEVGILVENESLSIAQEHALSAILKFHIGHMLYKHVENKNKLDFNIAISTPEGELHEFGIMISSLLCAYYNINFFYLGPNMPARSLYEAANQIKAKIIILGVSKSYHMSEDNNLDTYVGDLTEGMDEKMKLWVGGISKLSPYLNQGQIEVVPTLNMLDQKLSLLVR